MLSAEDDEVKCLVSQCDEPPDDSHVVTSRNWFSTLKVRAWVFRFIDNCRGRKHNGPLKVEEIEKGQGSRPSHGSDITFFKGHCCTVKFEKGPKKKSVVETGCLY